MGFFSKAKPIDTDMLLEQAVAEALGDAPPTTVRILAAVAGLLGAVAYADRVIAPEEEEHLRKELERLNGFSEHQVGTVAELLVSNALRLNTTFVPRFTRTLREELPPEDRCEVLSALLGMAAADGIITHDEVVNLRNLCTALGLSQAQYNELQSHHRHLLDSGAR